ncbi:MULTISPECIES: GerAB/ArcD/ProY family transporter [Brevibacillus]|jgi:spore germination protein KB|uniref:GerAB/ArcD/ProY family transporter n=1 Tax=Brevibacillus TaxID=55080 RepID=UPI0004698CA9|nr:GerAB/ArcD/ProY family transporter [Brevibacillus borstelensis]KKX53789.1 spore gernimation protein GerB [Brevibacillus borstelensis cifa_chp40]MBE5393781.1 GerAB/ArcD/ProY family transporter [Brevibacillus borstelensis]MCM3473268.1 spore germination protein [Brevibacillus borstelensis]MCM3560456.1 spore germination protein [Brevibacillus borstelensis]MCM3593440.1 spore germination protein [Brevibacillus borstelensis]
MEKIRISPRQLFCLIVLFELGSSLVIPLGADAGQDAWLAILAGLIAGLLIFQVYLYLYRQYPAIPLTGYIRKILGNVLGWPISLLYVAFFIYGSARITRDIGDLLFNSVYDETPLFLLHFLMLAAITYVLHKGFEVLARTGEVFFGIVMILVCVGILLVIFSGIVQFTLLQPVLENGWEPIFQAVVSQTYTFPFGQIICFAMILPYLAKPGRARRAGMTGLIVSGIILSLITALEISVLGADLVQRSTFPLLITLSKVDIANFLQRLDALVVFTLIIVNFFKISIFYYSAVIGAADLFKVDKLRSLILPIGVIILFSSMNIAGSHAEHSVEGDFYLKYTLELFVTVIPLFLLVGSFIRRLLGNRGESGFSTEQQR